MKADLKTKSALYEKCLRVVEQKVTTARAALAALKESATNETKSSAGDKHETGRAMMHLEMEKGARQLSQALELKKLLERIDPSIINNTISVGTLVITNKGAFFFAIPLGKITLEDNHYFVLSITSPVAQKFRGASKDQKISFNGQNYYIEELC